ncbi:MAG: hypothetical protein IT436_05335 [Phycisphaerales bacterium]|nr:hypothetical protein [Phycisphaerales bacterium]
MDRSERMLIIGDGGLASLIACAAAREAALITGASQPAVLWSGPARAEEAPQRSEAAERQAGAYGLELVVHTAPNSLYGPGSAPYKGLADDRLLMDVAASAIQHGCDRVIWPIHYGGPGHASDPAEPAHDLDAISAAVDRALLITRLVGIDAGQHARPAFRVETPYVDFTDRQIADLALDLDVPVETCWWWHREFLSRDTQVAAAPSPALERDWAQWRRWWPALRAVGWVPETTTA